MIGCFARIIAKRILRIYERRIERENDESGDFLPRQNFFFSVLRAD